MRQSNIPGWSPAWLQLLDEVGYRNLLGDPLGHGIEAILTRNEITQAIARSEIADIAARLEALQAATAHMIEGFEALHIGKETLEPGECEVGVLIPRVAVDNRLPDLADELQEINFVVRTIREVATGEAEPVEVRTLSSSDFFIFLSEHAGAAALLATVVERLIAGYQNILHVRKLHGELAEEMGRKKLKEVETYAATKMLATIKSIADDAIKTYPKKDTGRRNELRNSLDSVLKKLADRIDRGYNIEIRIEPLPEPSNVEQDPLTKTEIAQFEAFTKHRQTIEGAAKQLEFFYREGPPILHLEDKPKTKESTSGNPKPDEAP